MSLIPEFLADITHIHWHYTFDSHHFIVKESTELQDKKRCELRTITTKLEGETYLGKDATVCVM